MTERRDDISRVSVSLTITTTTEIVDSGYLGPEASVQEHLNRAREEVSRWTILATKHQGAEALPLRARVTVDSVNIVPVAPK